MAFSMALSGAKKSKPSVQPSAVGFGGTVADDEEPRVETVAVTEMMDGKTDADKEPEVKVIAAAPRGSASGSVVPVDEESAAAEAVLAELRAGGTSIFGADDTERYRRDVQTRADSTSRDGYEATSIEEFGKAYLRGYGWQEGNDGAPEPIEYVPRPQLLGLGAAPRVEESPADGSKKRFIKPGDTREPKKEKIYVDERGRQRHVKRVGDKLVEREASGFDKGALVAITAGPHQGLYGRVQSTGGMESDLKVVLKLTLNGEQLTLSAKDCAPVKDAQLERMEPGLTHQQHRSKADAVETALPKRGGTVLILRGAHRLRRGMLLERRSEDARAVVQLAGDLRVVEVSFDDVAEWVGGLGEQLDIADL
ncbi:hypothetical protein Ctob_009557 [Chrysochromulina tobinii]|uniref:Spp2/MOS2 G-patch domain-containing protein n=1 Tax=Chrysochromulina tobinii TaxID=1460289 RepID=A0A0M0K6V1_9EUKA|nr:hypothetical protein Ctob_009557 [Chrysochromulina tobinii]|eukprot:KOO34519.1 hypothetical protein Ctob_009557 [Chrysochromulina sp. CCMP291]